MSEIVTITLPSGMETWKPDPFPGGNIAINLGCTCPEDQPHPGRLCFSVDCPIHELEQAKH